MSAEQLIDRKSAVSAEKIPQCLVHVVHHAVRQARVIVAALHLVQHVENLFPLKRILSHDDGFDLFEIDIVRGVLRALDGFVAEILKRCRGIASRDLDAFPDRIIRVGTQAVACNAFIRLDRVQRHICRSRRTRMLMSDMVRFRADGAPEPCDFEICDLQTDQPPYLYLFFCVKMF